MRLSSSAAFWALLASTAPHGFEAKGLRRKLVATSECTIMAVEALPTNEEGPHQEMGLECELDPADADGISGITAPLQLSPKQRADLSSMIYAGRIDPGEDMLDIEGDEITEDYGIKIDPVVSVAAKTAKAPSAKARKQRRLVDTTGDLRMLLVKVTDSAGKTYPDNVATMSNEVFGTGNDPVNLKSGLEECSWNKLTVVPELVLQGDATSDMEEAPGVIQVSIGIPLDGSSDSAIRNAITTAVTNKLGHSLPGPYDYVLYSLENCYGNDCGWAAYAYINSWNSVYQNVYYKRPGVLMHELGHNFGLAHSGGLNGATYTDHTCTMGNPHYGDDTFQCFNPAKNFQLDWYDDAKIIEDPRIGGYSNTLTLVGVGEYDNREGNPVTVKLETGTPADYFVGFNRATGPNRMNDEGDDKVSIIEVTQGNGVSYGQSYLKALLSEGEFYEITDFGNTGKTVTVTVNSIDITTSPGTAVVFITDGQDPPPPTPPPTSPPPCPSGQKRYQVTVTTDMYPGETSYALKNTCTGTEILTGCACGTAYNSFPSNEVCAEAGVMEFVINDTWGDGLCCNYGEGGYVVTENGEIKASGGAFTSTETTTWISEPCGSTPTPPPTNPPTNVVTPPPTNPPTNVVTPPPTNPPTPPPTNAPVTPPPTNPPTPPPTNPPTAPPTNPPTPPPTNPPTNVVTPPPTNPVTPPPTSGDAVAQQAVFDASYGVPRCANVGSSCDSTPVLLNGKGTMYNGNEPNRSNTNKNGQACNDGNSGSYHSDESIDQIIVTAGDLDASGTPAPSGDFIVEGGRAYVTVKLWCWSTGASDHADLFLSSDASSPDWQPLTTITCPGGGAQTIRHAFDVPSGANQSIRVNFRYIGSPSTCSSGSYDDHDDLIFAVKSSSGGPPPTPPPVVSPPTAGPSGPQTASFDAGLKAPKCSFGSRCDSGAALNGRGTIANGNEPNKPNTLNACSDGNYGSYHSDESIDKIVVSRTDGGNGDFTEGDEVTITANIWCWSTGSSDYIDFYYASDAANPVWNQIGVRQACPGGQSQTVSKSFQLPAGGLQAVRVNLMYGSGTPGTNKCTSGGYDDTDDLVISVRPNAILAASMALPGRGAPVHDDVQATIVEMVHDEKADREAAALVELNASVREGDESPSTGSKSGKVASDIAATVSSTSKYICAKSKPLNDATICADGEEADNKCSYEGESCGGRKKKCYFAECDGFEADE